MIIIPDLLRSLPPGFVSSSSPSPSPIFPRDELGGCPKEKEEKLLLVVIVAPGERGGGEGESGSLCLAEEDFQSEGRDRVTLKKPPQEIHQNKRVNLDVCMAPEIANFRFLDRRECPEKKNSSTLPKKGEKWVSHYSEVGKSSSSPLPPFPNLPFWNRQKKVPPKNSIFLPPSFLSSLLSFPQKRDHRTSSSRERDHQARSTHHQKSHFLSFLLIHPFLSLLLLLHLGVA